MKTSLSQLARLLEGSFTGDPDLALHNVAKIEEAVAGEITFIANPKYQKFIETTSASAVIVSDKIDVKRKDLGVIKVSDPYIGFVKALQYFNPPKELLPIGIHEKSVVAETAVIGTDVRIGACSVIGDPLKIGNSTIIFRGAFLGDEVTIGSDCIIYPNVSVLWRCQIGNNVIVHAGATIGSDGFGFVPKGEGYEKIPQLGNVIIDDDVEIGANSTIDRATIGSTHIKRGVKIDNLVQVAHNVVIGEDTAIAAQTGISGSTALGKHVVLAGQVGLVGHIEIADNVIVTAQSGVSKSLTETGKMYRGSPAKEFHEELRLEAAMRRLPELIKTLRELQDKLERLEKEKILN